jgi:ornithine cyclodeaminase/alanine dehydrogenase-like protein (mu-crystallin family)
MLLLKVGSEASPRYFYPERKVHAMVFLNGSDILGLCDLDDLMDQVEEAYKVYEEKRFFMPDRWHIDHEGLTSLYMPCFLEDTYGTKVLSVAPRNREVGKPVIDGLMLLNDGSSGEILSIMDGKTLTALRTGAVGGVAIRHLTRSDITSAGIIGAGVQGYYQMLFACRARKISSIVVYDVSIDSSNALCARLKESLGSGVDVCVAKDSEELVSKSEVIVTATTANSPVLPADPEKLRGKHFVGIGSYKPTMREYPDSFFGLLNKVYIDQVFAKGESGDLIDPLAQNLIGESDIECFSSFLVNETNKKDIVEDTTFFKSVGMALFDVVVARYIYTKAQDAGVGTELY